MDMRDAPHTETQFNLIIALWGLLFAKCFLLEFLVRQYAMPINSLIYVWALSILMATVATAVYANLQREKRPEVFWQVGFLPVVLAGAVTVLFVFRALISPVEQTGLTLALAALVLAIKHVWLWIRNPRTSSRWMAPGWFVGAMAIAYLGSPAGFLVFSLSVLSLSAVPNLARFFALRKRKVENTLAS